jgi:hypothetical protein
MPQRLSGIMTKMMICLWHLRVLFKQVGVHLLFFFLHAKIQQGEVSEPGTLCGCGKSSRRNKNPTTLSHIPGFGGGRTASASAKSCPTLKMSHTPQVKPPIRGVGAITTLLRLQLRRSVLLYVLVLLLMQILDC